MRVVHLSFSDLLGGAARGAYGLHRALLKQGVDSLMVVDHKESTDSRVIVDDSRIAAWLTTARRGVDRVVLARYRHRSGRIFSPATMPTQAVARVRSAKPDIVHLHWVANSFVRPEDVPRFGVPVVWTLRDMWPFTGGCHYTEECVGYQGSCGKCPHLVSRAERDLSRWVWSRKQRSWRNAEIVAVAMSEWMADTASSSSLFENRDVRTIPNAIDTGTWHRQTALEARLRFDVPADKRILLFIALDLGEERKGYRYFEQACTLLGDEGMDGYHALVVGAVPTGLHPEPGIPATFTGRLTDDTSIRAAYSAAHVAVLPSTLEAFGKTAAEALACGTPSVVFDRTGLASVVKHRETGYVADYADPHSLAAGIRWVAADATRWRALSERSRKDAVARFSADVQASAYVHLYDELLASG